MVNLSTLNRWNVDLAQAIEAMGSDAFFKLLFAAIRNQVRIAYPQVWLYHPERAPRLLAHDIPKASQEQHITRYCEGAYQQDPLHYTATHQPRSHIYRLTRLTAGHLTETPYYQTYYHYLDSADEVAFVAKLADHSVVVMRLLRLSKQGEFTEEEYDVLYALAETVSSVMKSHCHRDDFAIGQLIQPGLDHQINLAFKRFGSKYVSHREQEVLELMLRGYSTQSSAERLHISLETVRRHRKSIYKKLDVSSQTDLFALFINAMPYLGQAHGEDPLSIYMG